MIYIVTGLMRTGTSLMMQVLMAAGIRPFYSKAYERRSRGGRLRNPMFLEAQACIRGDISMVPDDRCVKVFLNSLHKVDLSESKHKVIAMWRSTEDRLRSTRQGMPYKQWVRYQQKCTHANVEVEQCYRDLHELFPNHLLVDFDGLIDNPAVVLPAVAEYIGRPLTDAMRAVVQPKRRHYRKG